MLPNLKPIRPPVAPVFLPQPSGSISAASSDKRLFNCFLLISPVWVKLLPKEETKSVFLVTTGSTLVNFNFPVLL